VSGVFHNIDEIKFIATVNLIADMFDLYWSDFHAHGSLLCFFTDHVYD